MSVHHPRVLARGLIVMLAAVATFATSASFAHATGTPAGAHRYALKAACRLRHAPARWPRTPQGMVALCRTDLAAAHTANVSYSTCGYAYVYDLAWFPGHMVTDDGVVLYAGINYGEALIGYNNLTTGKHADEWDAVIPNVAWNHWDGGRGWYTQGGLVRGWEYLSVYDRAGDLCYTPPGEPQDFLWVP